MVSAILNKGLESAHILKARNNERVYLTSIPENLSPLAVYPTLLDAFVRLEGVSTAVGSFEGDENPKG